MLGTRSSLEVSEGVITKCRSHEETEQVMALYSKDTSSSGFSIESVWIIPDHAPNLQQLGP